MTDSVSTASRVKVVRNDRVGEHHFLLELEAPALARSARPGQFALIRPVPEASDPLLGRPLAVFDASPEDGLARFLYLPSGSGTRLLSRVFPGGEVFVTGPLGKRFPLDGDTGAVAGIAGGTGVAGVHFALKTVVEKGGEAALFLGARTASLLVPAEVLAEGVPVEPATDDGSAGTRGTVLDRLEEAFEAGRIGRDALFLTAGPIPMMKAAAAFARREGLRMLVSLEARMGCGVGACRGCVVPATRPHPLYGFMHRAVCSDGPVFDAGEIDWDAL